MSDQANAGFMPESVEETQPTFREIPLPRQRKGSQPRTSTPPEAKTRSRVNLHVGVTDEERRLLKVGYLLLAIMSSLLGIAALAFTLADIWWSLTGPIEYRTQFQGLALMGVLTCSLAWAGAAAIGRLLLEPPKRP